jgi:serine/threonine protein kinase
MSTAPRRLGKYELVQQLGKGHSGEVWKAYDFSLRRDAALKIFHPDLQQSDPHFLNRVTNEGQQLTNLRHPNLVSVYEANVTRVAQANTTVAYLSMEYIEGETLADYIASLAQHGTFPQVSELVYLFTGLGLAIDYALQRDVIHGNIKPSNILLKKQQTNHFSAEEPVLADIGVLDLLGNTPSGGTSPYISPYYASPEQARGNPPTSRSDIYALGVILYELCTGVLPFRDPSARMVMTQHMSTLPTPLY